MTDARFPERWLADRRIQRLSDPHFRSFVTSLVWSVSNRTDGVIEPADLKLIPDFSKDSVRAFVAAELWEPRGAERGWLIAVFESTQTTRLQLSHLDEKRAKEREKKAHQRAAAKAASSTNAVVPGDIPRDVPTDDTGQDRLGQARPGQEGDQSGSEDHEEPLPLAAGAESLAPSRLAHAAERYWAGEGPNPYLEYR